jgi:protein-S-isoprenylcysteine O-methyltransferase Ste14
VTAAAAALALLYFVSAVLVRSLLQRRRTGDLGFRLGRGPTARVASALMTVGLGLTLSAPFLDRRGALTRLAPLDTGPVRTGGLVVLVASVAAVVAAQAGLRDSWRIGVDPDEHTDLVVDGLFARVRNPIFTAMVLVSIGMALAVPNLAALVALPFVVGGVELQVRAVEEPALVAQHGDAYREYTARVGRFVPRIGRRSGAPDPGPGAHDPDPSRAGHPGRDA